MMPSRSEKLERKNRLLEQLVPEHDIGLDVTSLNHLVAAIRATSPSERQKALDKATEAYKNALDDVLYLYENGGAHSEKQSTTL